MKIVIPDKIDFTPEQLKWLQDHDAKVFTDVPSSTEEIQERIKDADIITANYIDITPDLIDAAKNLKYIIVPAVGYEWVAADYAKTKGVAVSNCPSFNSQSVAELAVGSMVAASRLLIPASSDLRRGGWGPSVFVGSELSGKRLGLIGHGNIGKRIEKLARAFDMSIDYADSKTSPEALDQLIQRADYLVVCCPLNDKTRGMIDGRRLALMKESAYLVNVARGAIIDQPKLVTTLSERKIRGAALDVFDGEPLTGSVSEEITKLANLPNVVATPHIGASTLEAYVKLGDQIIDTMQAFLDGSPINLVN